MRDIFIQDGVFDNMLGYGNYLIGCAGMKPSEFYLLIHKNDLQRISKLCRENIGKENYIITHNRIDAMGAVLFFRAEQDMLYFRLLESSYV